VESKRYNGGTDQSSQAQSPKADGFCTGGTPTNENAYNVYMVRVTSPKQDYFLNSLQGPGVSNHTTYGIDYVAKIQANGGATLNTFAPQDAGKYRVTASSPDGLRASLTLTVTGRPKHDHCPDDHSSRPSHDHSSGHEQCGTSSGHGSDD
jgi:hypothetical protein